jgi:hypothetical protein
VSVVFAKNLSWYLMASFADVHFTAGMGLLICRTYVVGVFESMKNSLTTKFKYLEEPLTHALVCCPSFYHTAFKNGY